MPVKRIFLFIFLLLLQYTTCECQTPWSNFKWGHDSIKVNGQRAFVLHSALFLPVSFAGDTHRYYLQLDLSSSTPLLLYNLPQSIKANSIAKQPLYANNSSRCYKVNQTLKGRLGNTGFSLSSGNYLLIRRGNAQNTSLYQSPGNPIIGSIGIGYFLKKILIIDFPDEQFMVLSDTAKVPYRFSKAKYYVPAHIKGSKFFFPIHYGDTVFNNFFYETGSGIFDMVTSKKLWQHLTGKLGNEKSNFHVEVTMWGNKMEAIGAAAKMPIRVNKTFLSFPVVFYLPSCTNFKSTYGCSGMIGNSPFLSRAIVLDFIRSRFGLFSTY